MNQQNLFFADDAFAEVPRPVFELRPYQKECVSRIMWSKGRGLDGHEVIVLPTGAGKSLIIATVAKEMNEPILILQPSKEILEQNKEKLGYYVDPHEIGVYSASMNERTIRTYTLATIQSIYKKPELFRHFHLVVIDECLAAGTMVSGKRIEDIRVGDFVDSFNHSTGIVERKRVLATSKKKRNGSLALTDLGRASIISTSNHPIYTKRYGYVNADKLTKSDKVIVQKSSMQRMRMGCDGGDEHRFERSLEIQEMVHEEVWIRFLFKSLLSFFSGEVIIGTNDKKKSDEEEGGEIKDGENTPTHRSSSNYSRWKWARNEQASGTIVEQAWRWLVSRASDPHKEEEGSWISNLLQGGYRKSISKDCDRGGRKLSFFKKKTGSKKGEATQFARVDGVKILEQGSPELDSISDGGDFVYNIQVEDNENYFANGILVHNCHLLNPKSLDGMFRRFLKEMGEPKVIGLTATPYRMDTMWFDLGNGFGEVAGTIKIINRTKGLFWNRVMFNINVSDLIEQGYLCPLEYVDCSMIDHQSIPTNVNKTDFDIELFEKAISDRDAEIIKTISYAESVSKSVLVFCSSVAQAERLSSIVPDSACISAKTGKKDRAKIILDFKEGRTKTVFNMGVLTTGFDHPALDAIVLIRPTRSIALYYQMLGRGVRRAPGKTMCRVFDLSSNVRNLGRVETIKFVKREKWELESVLDDGTTKLWHNNELYRFTIDLRKSDDGERMDIDEQLLTEPREKNQHLRDALNSAMN